MQRQQIRLMAIIAAALGLLVLFLEQPWSRGEAKKDKPLYPGFHPDKVQRIEVINSQDTVNLVKRDPTWVVQGKYTFPADSAQVRRALDAVERFNANQIVSKNTSKFGVFQVDTTGASIKLYNDPNSEKPDVDFLLGKTSPEGSTYFRPAGKDQVYSSPDRVRSLFVRNARSWQDRSVTNMEPTEAARLIVERGDSTIVFEKGAEGKWSLTRLTIAGSAAGVDTMAVKQEAMDEMLQTACKLVANAFPDSAITVEQAGLTGKPMLRLKTERLDGSGVEVLVGSKDETGSFYYAKRPDREWIYKIGPYRIDPFYKDLNSIKADAAPSTPALPENPIPGG